MFSEDIIFEACALTCDRMNECISRFKDFKTEKEVKDFLNKGFELSFDTIVASGPNASEPHHCKDDKLNKGFCVIDFGIKHKGFCTDMTRTIYLGTPSPKEINLYNYLLKEHKKMLKQVKNKSNIEYIEKCFRKRIGNLNRLFIHKLSHGIGKVVHEKLPHFVSKNDIFSIEPGFYERNKYGIRIEDMVMIDRQFKKRVLTSKVSRELIIIN